MLAALALTATILQSSRAAAEPAKLTPAQWRAAAERDVEAIHDILRDNAPFMVVDRDSAAMRRWLETGRTEALKAASAVNDGYGYSFVLKRYAGGFRDGHIGVSTTAIPGYIPAWPGFVMTWKHDRYIVGWRAAEAADTAPPVGAELVSCDGQSADVLAARRVDRVLGNLQLPASRARSAFQLLRDYRYPQTPPPKTCVFRSAEGARSWSLRWNTPSAAEVDVAAKAAFEPSARFGVERWGSNAWWIGAPTMTGEDQWRALYAAVETHLDAIRAADVTVIDLRGNGGGNSDFGAGLARRLFGRELVEAHDEPSGELVFKDSPLSRAWAEDLKGLLKDHPDLEKEVTPVVAKLQAAPLGSKVVIADDPPKARPSPPPADPMRGKVVLLVDHACFSACLDTLDLFTHLPGVKLAGVTTGADTIFMDIMQAPLPSGQAKLHFGIKAWAQRRRGSNVAYEPDPALRYTGDLSDEAGLKRWLAAKLGVTGT